MGTILERRINKLEKDYRKNKGQEPTSEEDDESAKRGAILEVIIEAHGAFTTQGLYYPTSLPIRSTVALAVREVGRSGPCTIERIIPAILEAVEPWPEVRDFVVKGFIDKGLLPSLDDSEPHSKMGQL